MCDKILWYGFEWRSIVLSRLPTVLDLLFIAFRHPPSINCPPFYLFPLSLIAYCLTSSPSTNGICSECVRVFVRLRNAATAAASVGIAVWFASRHKAIRIPRDPQPRLAGSLSSLFHHTQARRHTGLEPAPSLATSQL